jgi:hypothetical protein
MVEEIRKSEPTPGLGGVSLNGIADVPLDPAEVKEADYKSSTGRIHLRMHGGHQIQIMMPSMGIDGMRECYQIGYILNSNPELSIGSQPRSSDEPKSQAERPQPGKQAVYYLPARMRDTRLGSILFQADNALGQLAFGSSATVRQVVEAVPGFHSLPELFMAKYAANPAQGRYLQSETIYMHPAVVELEFDEHRNELRFSDTEFDVNYGSTGSAEAAFGIFFQTHYSEITKTDLGAPLGELVPYAQVVALFRWLKQNGITLKAGQLTGPSPFVLTPHDVPLRPLVRLSEITPLSPITLFGPFGATSVYDSKGNEFGSIQYKNGLPILVSRADGRTLQIDRDDMGVPFAMRVGDTEADAFLVDPSLGLLLVEKAAAKPAGDELTVEVTAGAIEYPISKREPFVDAAISYFIVFGTLQ